MEVSRSSRCGGFATHVRRGVLNTSAATWGFACERVIHILIEVVSRRLTGLCIVLIICVFLGLRLTHLLLLSGWKSVRRLSDSAAATV